MRLFDYETGRELVGTLTAELIHESMQAAPTGAVYAILDEAKGMWDYLPANQRPTRGDEAGKILRVYVMP